MIRTLRRFAIIGFLLAAVAGCADKTPTPVSQQSSFGFGGKPLATPTDAKVIETYDAARVDAAEMARILRDVLGVSVTSESKWNTVILWGERNKVDQALKLAQELDLRLDGARFGIFFIYPLQNARAPDVLTTFQLFIDKGMFRDELTDQPTIALSADARTNSVLVACRSRDEQDIRHILEKLDKEVADESILFIYPLKNADATRIATMLGSLAGMPQSNPDDRQPMLKVMPDERTNSLVITCMSKREGDVRQFIELMDRPVAGQGRPQ